MEIVDKSSYRNFLITRHIPEGELLDWQSWLRRLHSETKATYVVGQLECGELTEGLHIQAYANYSQKKSFMGLKKWDTKMHIEICRNAEKSERYCFKEKSRVEGPLTFGIKPVRRNNKDDWEEVLVNAKTGQLDSIPASILVQHYGNISKISRDNMKAVQCSHLRGIFIWGLAGCGKSTMARSLFPEYGEVYEKQHNKWWDGYKDEKVVVWDDICPEEAVLSRANLRRYCDRTAICGETKGSGVPLNYEFFIMTSQYPLKEVFPDPESYEAMERRTFVFHMFEDPITKVYSQFSFARMREKLYTGVRPDIEKRIIRD